MNSPRLFSCQPRLDPFVSTSCPPLVHLLLDCTYWMLFQQYILYTKQKCDVQDDTSVGCKDGKLSWTPQTAVLIYDNTQKTPGTPHCSPYIDIQWSLCDSVGQSALPSCSSHLLVFSSIIYVIVCTYSNVSTVQKLYSQHVSIVRMGVTRDTIYNIPS